MVHTAQSPLLPKPWCHSNLFHLTRNKHQVSGTSAKSPRKVNSSVHKALALLMLCSSLTCPRAPYSHQALIKRPPSQLVCIRNALRNDTALLQRRTQSCPSAAPPTTFKGSATPKMNLTQMLTKFFMRAVGRHGCAHVRAMKRLESNLHIL